MTIKAVIWDLAGVLLHMIRGTFNSMLAERLEAPLETVERVMSSPENDLWDMDEIGDDEFYDFVIREIGLPAEKKAAMASFVIDDFYIDQELLAYIRNLHTRYTTALLTNFPGHLHEFLRSDWRVDGAFDHMIASCDVKLLKPDPKIYQLTLERIGCKAKEAVFIDDREVNVRVAEKLGIYGIVYQNREQAIEDLEYYCRVNIR